MYKQRPKIWTGAVSDEWNANGNWNPVGPPLFEDAHIATGAPVMPVLNSNGMGCGNLIIEHGATLTVLPGFTITVYGKVVMKN